MRYLLFIFPFICLAQDYNYMTVDGEIMNLIQRLMPNKIHKRDYWFEKGPGKKFTYQKLVVPSGKPTMAEFQSELAKLKSDQQSFKDERDEKESRSNMYRANATYRSDLQNCKSFINTLDPNNLAQADYGNILRCFILKNKTQ